MMPLIGLGTYRMRVDIDRILTEAIQIGYRLIDTASVYNNEEAIGQILKSLNTKDLFITSKLGPKDQGSGASQAVLDSLQKLNLTSLDLMLIHWPGSAGLKPEDPRNRENRIQSWKALEEHVRQGRLKAIGVSNFTRKHLEDLLSIAEIVPCVNQIELHPLIWTRETQELVEYCTSKGIQVQAYSSFGEGQLVNGSIHIPELETIAMDHQSSVAQVLLAWALSHNWMVIPKASSRPRLEENFASLQLKLSSQEIEVMDGLAQKYGPKRFCWNPEIVA